MASDDIATTYGTAALHSAPADPDNPSFASLLSALQAVHQGELPPSVLQTYHRHLCQELATSRHNVQQTASGHPLQMTLTTLDLAQIALDSIPDYLASPSANTMAECVQRFLIAQNAMSQLHYYLDQHQES